MPVFCDAAHISTSDRVGGNGFNGITLPVCHYKHCGVLISYDTFRVARELTSLHEPRHPQTWKKDSKREKSAISCSGDVIPIRGENLCRMSLGPHILVSPIGAVGC
jgi:hypothetical protein